MNKKSIIPANKRTQFTVSHCATALMQTSSDEHTENS